MMIWTFDDIVDQPEPPTKEAIARDRKRQLDYLRELRQRLTEGESSKAVVH